MFLSSLLFTVVSLLPAGTTPTHVVFKARMIDVWRG